MTTYNGLQNGFIYFGDRANGTSGGDNITLDTSKESDHPGGDTSIDGKGGNDHIEIGAYAGIWDPVTVDGGTGNDNINIDGVLNSSQDITIDGGSGDDRVLLDVSGFSAAVNLSDVSSFTIAGVHVSGIEALSLTTGSGDDTIQGGSLNDFFSGGAGLDTLRGSGGSDTLEGGADHDELFGGSGGDALYGGGGNDTLFGGLGINTIDGGLGSDTADYSAEGEFLGGPVEVNLVNGRAELTPDDHDTLTSVENIVGTSFNDTIAGNLGVNKLYGLGGDDVLVGSPGDPGDPSDLGDFLYGGIGKDSLYGKYGNDTLEGGDGNDTIYGGDGGDTIYGGDNNDMISGGLGADTMDGGAGKDTLDYSSNATYAIKFDMVSGKQFLKNDQGVWHFTGETGVNFEIVKGGDANEEFVGGDNDDLFGNGGNDVLRTAGNDGGLYGGDGNDKFYVEAHSKGFLLFGGNGDDTFFGGEGSGLIAGGAGADTVHGGAGKEQIYGDGGNDGVDGVDTLYGGGGDDNVIGEAKGDTLDGGAGSDVIVGGDSLDTDVINRIRGGDLPPSYIFNYNTHNSDTAANTLNGGDGKDWLFGGAGKDTIDGGSGNDAIDGGRGNDIIDGGPGKDNIIGGEGDDVVIVASLSAGESFLGGAGTAVPPGFDTLDMSAIGVAISFNFSSGVIDVGGTKAHAFQFDKIIGGHRGDTFVGSEFNNSLFGEDGDDTLNGGGGSDTLNGGDGEDTASYDGGGAVTVSLAIAAAQNTGGAGKDTLKNIENLTGSAHNDKLTGDGGANKINGGDGNDTLNGNGGADHMTGGNGKDSINGGAGGDTFVYRSASESTGAQRDTVRHADFTSDKWDVPAHVSGIDAKITHGVLKAAHFDANMAAVVNAAHLKAHHAVLFTPSSGDLAGKTFLIVDLNGAAGYQGGDDLVVQLVSPAHLAALGANDFI